jgi:hypothetical protein
MRASGRTEAGSDDRGEGAAIRAGISPAPDYFTDAVPLRGDREAREREERMRRLKQGRRRGPSLRPGMIVAALVVLVAGTLFAMGRHGGENGADARPGPDWATAPAPAASAAPAPRIGPARAVAIARARPRNHRPDRRVHRRRQPPPAGAVQVQAATEPAGTTEIVEPEVTAEAAPSPESSPSTPAAHEPESASTPSSTTEAEKQFGFGR